MGTNTNSCWPLNNKHNFLEDFYQDENLFSELSLTTSEARLGTEKEILVKRGWGTERVIIYIAPGVKNDTVYSLSLEGEGGRREEKLYLKMKVVTN